MHLYSYSSYLQQLMEYLNVFLKVYFTLVLLSKATQKVADSFVWKSQDDTDLSAFMCCEFVMTQLYMKFPILISS